MRLILLTLIYLTSCIISNGQTNETIQFIDSLNKQSFALLDKDILASTVAAQKALSLSKELNYARGMGDAFMRFGEIEITKLNYDKAIEYYSQAQSLREKNGFDKEATQSLAAIGKTLTEYSTIADLEVAESYRTRAEDIYQEALNTAIDLRDTSQLSRIYIHLGVHFGNNNLDSSTTYFKNAFKLCMSIMDSVNATNALNNISSNFNQLKLYDSSLYYAHKARKMACKGCSRQRAATANLLGVSYYMKELDDSALYYYLRCEKISIQYGYDDELTSVYDNLINYHAYFDNGELVQQYYTAYQDITLKTRRKHQNQAFAIAQEEFHTTRVKAENTKTKLRNQRLGIALIAALLVALGSLFLWRYARQKQRIAIQEKDLSDQKIDNLLQTQEMKNLDAMLDGQEKERQRIAADLHDRLGSMLSAVKLHFSSIEEKIDVLHEENKVQYHAAKSLLDSATEEVRKISHDMATGTVSKFGLTAALYELKNMLEASGKIRINISEYGLYDRLEVENEISLYRIIQELTANTLKHAKADTLSISITKHSEGLNIMVEDNGLGFDPSITSAGIGLKNIRQRAQKIGASIHIDSKEERGTTVVIEFPQNT